MLDVAVSSWRLVDGTLSQRLWRTGAEDVVPRRRSSRTYFFRPLRGACDRALAAADFSAFVDDLVPRTLPAFDAALVPV